MQNYVFDTGLNIYNISKVCEKLELFWFILTQSRCFTKGDTILQEEDGGSIPWEVLIFMSCVLVCSFGKIFFEIFIIHRTREKIIVLVSNVTVITINNPYLSSVV